MRCDHAGGSLVLQRRDEGRDGFEEIADNRKDTRSRLALVEGHDRGLGVTVEGDDGGAGADVIQMLR